MTVEQPGLARAGAWWGDVRRQVAGVLAPLIDLALPPRCPLCGDAVARQGGLCVTCWAGLVIPAQPWCSQCQRPVPDRTGEQGIDAALALADAAQGRWVCAPCMAEPPGHDGITAATLYNATSRRLVLAYKHGRQIALADLMVRLIVPRLPALDGNGDGDWVVVPVPLHRWRLWRRGFNQSALIARGIAGALGRRLIVDALERPRATPALGHLGRRRRAALLQGAIVAGPALAQRLQGASVLLVDDVLTSGATTDACIRVLRRAGAARVRIVCFSRVIDETSAIASHSYPRQEGSGNHGSAGLAITPVADA